MQRHRPRSPEREKLRSEFRLFRDTQTMPRPTIEVREPPRAVSPVVSEESESLHSAQEHPVGTFEEIWQSQAHSSSSSSGSAVTEFEDLEGSVTDLLTL